MHKHPTDRLQRRIAKAKKDKFVKNKEKEERLSKLWRKFKETSAKEKETYDEIREFTKGRWN